METDPELTGETVELLRTLIRNSCVNDGTPDSGQEVRSADTLAAYLDGVGLDIETFEPHPGRVSLVARLEGTDPDAPTTCLMGHTDVVPVTEEAWRHDPFGGALIDGEVWGRGAVDMLNLTASMAVATRHLAVDARPPGDLVYLAVADEEAGGLLGARPLTAEHWDVVGCDYVLTEFGGLVTEGAAGPRVVIAAAEKGLAWTTLRVGGTPGHGSMPWGADNALVRAAEVVHRLGAATTPAHITEAWRGLVSSLGLPDDLRQRLLDPGAVRDALADLGDELGSIAHAMTHMTVSPNVLHAGSKVNVIPDEVTIEVDLRTLPGQTADDVDAFLDEALGDLREVVEIEAYPTNRDATASPTDTPMWDVLSDLALQAHPDAEVVPTMIVGGTDAAYFRQRGAVAYGAGLYSRRATMEEFRARFHGHDERVDVESLALTTALWPTLLARLG